MTESDWTQNWPVRAPDRCIPAELKVEPYFTGDDLIAYFYALKGDWLRLRGDRPCS